MFKISIKKYKFILPEGTGQRGTKPPRIANDTVLYLNPTPIFKFRIGKKLRTGFRHEPEKNPHLVSYLEIKKRANSDFKEKIISVGILLCGTFYKKNPKNDFLYQAGLFFPNKDLDIEAERRDMYSRHAWVGIIIPEEWEYLNEPQELLDYTMIKNRERIIARIGAMYAPIQHVPFPPWKIDEHISKMDHRMNRTTSRLIASHFRNAGDYRFTVRKRICPTSSPGWISTARDLIITANLTKTILAPYMENDLEKIEDALSYKTNR